MSNASRLASAGAAAVCLLVLVVACYQSVILLGQMRAERLAATERNIAQATVPLIRQDRVSPALVRAAEKLLVDPRLDLNYITLRNAENTTLVSRGRFEDTLSWLPNASARQWRGLLYRMLSAEGNYVLRVDGQIVGFVQYGISWLSTLFAAGTSWLFWTVLMLAAGAGFCWLGIRLAIIAPGKPIERQITAPVPSAGTRPAPAKPSKPIRGAKKGAFPFKARRSQFATEEYAPIMPASRGPEPVESPETPPPRSQATVPEHVPPEPAPPEPRAPEPATPEQPVAPETPTVPLTVPEQLAAVEPKPPARANAAPAPGPEMPAAEFHAPQLDAEPALGDDTLDLHFYPIWRGADRRALAGAWATLAWRSGDAELVDAATLTRLAERDGALRAFTHWIARRFSVLHSNWRNLELNTVPIVLPVPTAMLAFADAEAVWQDAIVRTDRDPDDLILKLTCQSAERNPNQLPIRHALTAGESADMGGDCDVLCIKPADVSESRERWQARLDEPGLPILFGPVDEPEQWQDTLNHERVVWFSEERSWLCSTRDFARLLARRECRAF